jgi:citrate lyase subunit beta/citryl-CoA lyase
LELADDLLDDVEARTGESVTMTMALIESARGVRSLDQITTGSRHLVGLSIGFADLAASLARPTPVDVARWRTIREHVLIAGRAENLAVIDGPHLGVAVDDDFQADVAEAVALGFDAKWVIHPGQVAEVSRAFAPSADAIARARRIVEALDEALAHGSGVVSVDDLMVDEAVAISARRLISQSENEHRG